MKSILFDAHCHLENERFEDDLDSVMERMKEHGVMRCLCAGSDIKTSEQIVQLTTESSIIYGAVGVHPHEARYYRIGDEDMLKDWLSLPRIVAIGEIGLDYYYDHSPRQVQRDVFVAQLDLAFQQGVPAIFHVRDAHGDVLDIFRAHRNSLPSGVLHCYSGSVESAKEYLDMGFYLSFAGPVTFKNARNLVDVAAYCPADRLLIETDSPYLAPEPVRGKRNEPANVRFVAARVAEIRGVELHELCELAWQNTCTLFGINS